MYLEWDFNNDGYVDDMDTVAYIANVLEPMEREEEMGRYSGSDDDFWGFGF